jgi:hypothetical protein
MALVVCRPAIALPILPESKAGILEEIRVMGFCSRQS